jgi:hypothetical protein
MTNKLTALLAMLNRCEKQHAITAHLKPEEVTLARECVEAVIKTRAALAEIDRLMEAPCGSE